MSLDPRVVERFFQVLVEEIRAQRPEYLGQPFTVAEIYQSLVPYRSHRDRIGVELNGDYEEALLLLLGGGDPPYLKLESDAARERIRREVGSKNPNTGIFREYAALDVRIAPERRGALEAAPSPEPIQDAPVVPPSASDGEADQADAFTASTGSTLTAGTGRSADAGAQGSGIPRQEVADMRESPGALPASPAPLPESCPECHRGLPDREELRFCPFCGTDVHVVPCLACGVELERGWAFCVACGEATGS